MRILLTGATGVVGSESIRAIRHSGGHQLVAVARTADPDRHVLSWRIGEQPPGPELAGPWDAIVHTAASTRWTMTTGEAELANIAPLRAVLRLAGPDTHVVHVSTAYVQPDADNPHLPAGFDGHRNGYEWSKARCEELVREIHPGPLTIVRPPLVLGNRADGAIARFSGPYTLFKALVSGLAALLVGDPHGYVEIAPADQVGVVVAAAAAGPAPDRPAVHLLAAGVHCLTLAQALEIICTELNGWRAGRGAPPIGVPPVVSYDSWHRFFLPLAHRHLTDVQLGAVELLAMFEGYTSMATPFVPTHQVAEPGEVLARSVRWWAQRRPRLAAQQPRPWSLVGEPETEPVS